jgi:hypothetical protein
MKKYIKILLIVLSANVVSAQLNLKDVVGLWHYSRMDKSPTEPNKMNPDMKKMFDDMFKTWTMQLDSNSVYSESFDIDSITKKPLNAKISSYKIEYNSIVLKIKKGGLSKY